MLCATGTFEVHTDPEKRLIITLAGKDVENQKQLDRQLMLKGVFMAIEGSVRFELGKEVGTDPITMVFGK